MLIITYINIISIINENKTQPITGINIQNNTQNTNINEINGQNINIVTNVRPNIIIIDNAILNKLFRNFFIQFILNIF